MDSASLLVGPASSASCSPAPYGRACLGCSKAKCKCFFRAESTDCERCHRLGKKCEPSAPARKRKAGTEPSQTQQQPTGPTAPPPNRLEEKLDDLLDILRAQAIEKRPDGQTFEHHNHDQQQQQQQQQQNTPQSISNETDTPCFSQNDVTLDTDHGVFQVLPPGEGIETQSPIMEDIASHRISETMADERLENFRKFFLPMFPLVHIPTTMCASQLRSRSPFLWLVIMALASKSYRHQFAIEKTIWHIINQRIVVEHVANLDLLNGLIAFTSWAHFFKKDKSFMCMLTQMAIALAHELGIHEDPPKKSPRRTVKGITVDRDPSNRRQQQEQQQAIRTIEERRAILALFHLSSATWMSYRKTRPMRWTPYLDRCTRALTDGAVTDLDILLVTQVRTQRLVNKVTCEMLEESLDGEESNVISPALVSALRGQLSEIRQSLPPRIWSTTTAQFYVYHAEVSIRACLLSGNQNLSNFQRLQDLDALLTSIERWFAVYYSPEPRDFWGITVDVFSQMMHCVVVVFRMTASASMGIGSGENNDGGSSGQAAAAATTAVPGWDSPAEVRRRADVFAILDYGISILGKVSTAVGLQDDAEEEPGGGRRGIMFKAGDLFAAIKMLLLAEAPPGMLRAEEQKQQQRTFHMGSNNQLQSPSSEGEGFREHPAGGSNTEVAGDSSAFVAAADGTGFNFSMDQDNLLPPEFMQSIWEEPWMTDILDLSWTAGL